MALHPCLNSCVPSLRAPAPLTLLPYFSGSVGSSSLTFCAYNVKNDYDWTSNYYSPEAREKLEQNRRTTPQEVVDEGQRAWTALIAEVETAATDGTDPTSDRGRDLARRWNDLVGQFTKGDAEVGAGLNKVWSDKSHWPSDFKRPWSDAADAFITKAQAANR